MVRPQKGFAAKGMWNGEKLYQIRARSALPVLVRQAQAGAHLTYTELANELCMPNPRNCGYVLGSVGRSLLDLCRSWNEDIPPIQCLAVSADTDFPGPGFGDSLPDAEKWQTMSARQKRRLIDSLEQRIYAYHKWPEVLEALNLEPVNENFSDLLKKASLMRAGGESDAHKELKEYVRTNPSVIKIKTRGRHGRSEERLPSGDRIDVFFDTGNEWIAVECKPASSDEADLTRGLYQCIKYTAVLRAVAAAMTDCDANARSVLVISGILPERVRTLQRRLGVDVIEGLTVPQ